MNSRVYIKDHLGYVRVVDVSNADVMVKEADLQWQNAVASAIINQDIERNFPKWGDTYKRFRKAYFAIDYYRRCNDRTFKIETTREKFAIVQAEAFEGMDVLDELVPIFAKEAGFTMFKAVAEPFVETVKRSPKKPSQTPDLEFVEMYTEDKYK